KVFQVHELTEQLELPVVEGGEDDELSIARLEHARRGVACAATGGGVWRVLLGPEEARSQHVQGALEQEVSTFCPRPVRSRARRASIRPYSNSSGVEGSAYRKPSNAGSPDSGETCVVPTKPCITTS